MERRAGQRNRPAGELWGDCQKICLSLCDGDTHVLMPVGKNK